MPPVRPDPDRDHQPTGVPACLGDPACLSQESKLGDPSSPGQMPSLELESEVGPAPDMLGKSCLQRYDHAPIADLVGMRVLPHETLGQATVRLDVDTRHHNPMGTVHGGILALLADTAMGVAFGRTLESQQSFGTIDLRVDFIRPVTTTQLTAVGRIVKRGARVGFMQAEVHNQQGKLVATGNCTCLVVSPEPPDP